MISDNRIPSSSTAPIRSIITENRADLTQIFTALRNRTRPERPVEETSIIAFERQKRNAKIQNANVNDVQSALQVFYEIHRNASNIMHLVAQLQDVSSQMSEPTLSPDKVAELTQQAQEIQKELKQSQLPGQDSLKPLLQKYDNDYSLPDSIQESTATLAGLPVNLSTFNLDLTQIETLDISPAQQSDNQKNMADFGDRLHGLIAYVEAFQSRIRTKLKVIEKQPQDGLRRVASSAEAKQLSAQTSQQIVAKARQAFQSQANIGNNSALALLAG